MKAKTIWRERIDWLNAAQEYYLGIESNMSDHEWDRVGRELFAIRSMFPLCPILNDPNYYAGGSLYWVNKELYEKALQTYIPEELT